MVYPSLDSKMLHTILFDEKDKLNLKFSNTTEDSLKFSYRTGTRNYLPPEILNRQVVPGRSSRSRVKLLFGAADMWSL